MQQQGSFYLVPKSDATYWIFWCICECDIDWDHFGGDDGHVSCEPVRSTETTTRDPIQQLVLTRWTVLDWIHYL